MRRSKGRPFSSHDVSTIKRLLESTELTLQEIATRMSCAKSSIVAINQQFHIRNYQGRKRYWISAVTHDDDGQVSSMREITSTVDSLCISER
jgi:hypothetical protein